MNHTTHLDPPSSALRVSDAFFMSLEAQSRQTQITVVSGSPKQLRKQSEKSSFGLLGHLRLHICITGLRVKRPRNLTIYVKMTGVGCRYKVILEDFGRNRHSRVNSASREPTAHSRAPRAPARTRPLLALRSRARSACLPTCPKPVHIRTCMPLHPNILPRIPPSHPTLKHFPDSFLVSRGKLCVPTGRWTLPSRAIQKRAMRAPTRVHIRGTELSPIVEEYAALIQWPMPTRDIVVPNQFATIQSRLAILLDLRDEEICHELRYGWEHSVRTAWLIEIIHVRSLSASGESYQRDACHGFLLLIFGTILFPYSLNLIDGALAQRSSIRTDLHLFVGYASHGFRKHRKQTFQTPRVPSKGPCARSCSPSGRSEIDSAASLWIYGQSSLITESFRGS
ncbi:hypothetical protein CRG98_010017 [Punica granatum]|uniref:Uncharacterized protein n=1 Tax=Punica granatum TaxID=22663 RepID=A0A2I0KMA1_PUNGR|nr:hypothetical protein CRG98_010017 [Punica granatum]